MTDEEADRNLGRYARNEKMIDGLLGRLSNVSQTFASFIEATRTSPAREERSRAMAVLEGDDLREDIGKLGTALLDRERLEGHMERHGFSHMIRHKPQRKEHDV